MMTIQGAAADHGGHVVFGYFQVSVAPAAPRTWVVRPPRIAVMSASSAILEREQSLGEEIANSVSHGAGLVTALAATPLLLTQAAQRGGAALLVGTSLFAATILLLYLASTLYHALPQGQA